MDLPQAEKEAGQFTHTKKPVKKKLLPLPEDSFLNRWAVQLALYVGLSIMDEGWDGSQRDASLRQSVVTVVNSCGDVKVNHDAKKDVQNKEQRH